MKKISSKLKKHIINTRHIAFKIMSVALLVLASVGLSGCYIDGGVWSPAPPYGWNNTFYDQNLNGYWQLEMINGSYVYGDNVNYMYFGGNGRGRYYYYNYGSRYWENTAYWCQDAVSGYSNYQINIQYETSGSPSTMNYYLADRGRTLVFQWFDQYSGRSVEYVYTRISYQPW